MTLLGNFTALLVLLIVSIVLAGAGKRVLRLLGVETSSALDTLLFPWRWELFSWSWR